MVAFLSAPWAARAAALAPESGDAPDGRVQLVVTGAAGGEAAVSFVVAGGRLTEAGVGRLADAEVTFTTTAAEARALATGELDPSVAVMQGRLKVAGDYGLCLRLLPRTRHPAWRAWRAALGAETEF